MAERLPSQRSCFVMMPYCPQYRLMLKRAILPAVESHGMECVLADQSHVGSIPDQIIGHIQRSVVCLAEISETNANVMYEVGMAQAMGKPVIFLRKNLEDLPFDIQHMRIITYSDGEEGMSRLQEDITRAFMLADLAQVSAMLVPAKLRPGNGWFVIAASPLSWRGGRGKEGGFKSLTGTLADSFGIRSLMLEFGSMHRRDRTPELLNPEDYTDEVVKHPMHLYSLGSPKANKWTGFVMREFNKQWLPMFTYRATGDNLRDVNLIVQKDGEDFMPCKPSFEEDFGLIIRGPNPFDTNYMVTILAGCRSTGTEAACRGATDARLLSELSQKHGVDIDDFEKAFYAVVGLRRHGASRNYAADEDSLTIMEAGLFERRHQVIDPHVRV